MKRQDEFKITTTSEQRKKLKQYTIMNSAHFAEMFFEGQTEIIEDILRDMLGDPDLEVIEVFTEKEKGFPGYKYSRFDVLALAVYQNADHKMVVNIEFQERDEQDIIQRSIEYQSQLVMENLPRGEKAVALPKIVLIFFTNFDVIGHGIAFCKLDSVLTDIITGKKYVSEKFMNIEPERYFLNVSSLAQEEYRHLPVGQWAHDFLQSDSDLIINHSYKQRMDYFKNTQEGETKMFELDRETFREGEIRGRKEGIEKGRKAGIEEGRKEGIKLGEQNAQKQVYEKLKAYEGSGMDSEKILEMIKEELKPKSQLTD